MINLSLFVNYAVVMRPKRAKTDVHGFLHSGSVLFTVVLRGNAQGREVSIRR
mgnify:CR=1 FL=1